MHKSAYDRIGAIHYSIFAVAILISLCPITPSAAGRPCNTILGKRTERTIVVRTVWDLHPRIDSTGIAGPVMFPP